MKTILYLGGSITCGAFATEYEKCWASISYQGIASTLFGDDVRMVNVAISGTGSHLAAFRFSEHVLPYQPDLVFIEFSVNDLGIAKKDPALVIASMDYLVQTMLRQNPQVSIVFVYTTSKGKNAAALHTLVAQHYGILEIDLQTPACEMVERGEKEWTDLLCDGVHPTNEGHALYGKLVAEAVLAARVRVLTPLQPKPPISELSFCNPRILPAEQAISAESFTVQAVQDRVNLKRSKELVIHKAAVGETIGARLSFSFEGAHFGVYHRIGNWNGRFRIVIDGVEQGVCDTYHRYGDGTDPLGEFVSFFRVHGLDNGKHLAELSIIEPNPESKGSRIEIAGILVG